MLRDGDDLLFKAQVEVWTSSLNEHHQNLVKSTYPMIIFPLSMAISGS